MQTPYTVMVVMEAILGRESELEQALREVVGPSRAENSCIEYRLHQDLNNPSTFLLYEIWKSKEDHQLQFEKPYILSLAKKIENILARPYQVFFASEIQ